MKTFKQFLTESTAPSVKTSKAGTLTFKKTTNSRADVKGDLYLTTSPIEYKHIGMKGDPMTGKAIIGFDDEKFIALVDIEKSEFYKEHKFEIYGFLKLEGRNNLEAAKLSAIKTLFSRNSHLDGEVVAKSSAFSKTSGLTSWK